MKARRLALSAVASASLLLVTAWWVAGSRLSAPASRRVGEPPANLALHAVEIDLGTERTLRGWALDGEPGRGVVMLFHGVRADRRSMLGRATFLAESGFGLLLLDLQAHGESDGEQITFGDEESRDVSAALAWSRERWPDESIGAIGSSLGGAACLLGEAPLEVDALVLEAVYPSIEEAIANRLAIRLGRVGRMLTPLLTSQWRLRTGRPSSVLRPIERIGAIEAPLLMIAGSDDRRTTLEQSRALFAAAPEPKRLWVVEGAAHVDMHRFDPSGYESRVASFLTPHLTAR